MFDDMVAQIREDTMRMILSVMPRPQAEIKREAVAEVTASRRKERLSARRPVPPHRAALSAPTERL